MGTKKEQDCRTSERSGAPIESDVLERLRADVAWRIHEAFDFRSEREIACILRIPCRSAEAFISGREFPPTEILLQIHRATGVSLHWILTGEGPRSGMVVKPMKVASEEWVSLGLA